MKFRIKELTILLFAFVVVFVDAAEIAHRHRHSALAEEIEIMKAQHRQEIHELKLEMSAFRKEILAQCSGHRVRHASITEVRNEEQTLNWTRKAMHELHVEIEEVAKNVNSSELLHQLHNLHNHMKRIISENADFLNLGRTLEARLDKMDGLVERLKYENKNMEIMIGEIRQQISSIAKEVKHKILEKEEALYDMDDQNSVQDDSEQLMSEKRKIRHNKMIHTQISRLSHAQDQLDANQQNIQVEVLDHKHRLDRLEEPNWNLIAAKIDLLELESKIFSDRLNNNTRTISDFDKVHASILELREDLEAVENKMDKTIPEFRKEISRLDVNQAQMNAHFSYIKENQENIRNSVKAIAVSMSNAQDRAENDREELKKINNTVNDLTGQTKKHYYRLNDHILKSEANGVKVPETDLTEIISLPELMGEVKELQPVEHEYQDLVAQLPKDCTGISGPVGSYIIRPVHDTIDVWCINGTTLIQRRYNGSVEFNRKFAEYVHGFGDPASEYWIGLETMHQITADNCTSMRIEMTDIYGAFWYAQYDNFFVGNADSGYVLAVSGFTGNASDAFEYQNNMEFSAIDRDRDISNTNCAANYEGGWWFSHCQHVNINGKYNLGLTWFDSVRNEWIAVATSEMRTFRRPGCI